jgi:hypothetical protein
MACWISLSWTLGMPEMPLTAIRFGNGLAPGGTRLVSPFQELPPDFRPLVPEGGEEFGQGDAVGARGSVIRPDVLPGRCHVGLGDNPFHQVL